MSGRRTRGGHAWAARGSRHVTFGVFWPEPFTGPKLTTRKAREYT